LNGHDDWVNSVAYSPDGKRIASASYDHTVRLWNTSTYEQVLILKGHSGYVYNALFSPDGRRIASGSVDGTLKLWEPDRTIAIN
jgi:WD40 repeat protein